MDASSPPPDAKETSGRVRGKEGKLERERGREREREREGERERERKVQRMRKKGVQYRTREGQERIYQN